jgi:hypothetical protein
METFKRGDKCKIVSGPFKESNDTIIIRGTAQDTWSVDIVEAVLTTNKNLLMLPAITIYMAHCVKEDKQRNFPNFSINDLKEDHKDVFYYGHSQKTNFGNCFHPTWLEKIEDNAS